MSEQKHTPGPWTDECSVPGYPTRRITTCHVLAVPIAEVVHGEANARLITTAPDGLALAHLVRRYFVGNGPAPSQGEVVDAALELITKARGGE